MIFIYSLIFVLILSLFFTSSIKKNYWTYYLISIFIGIITTVYEVLRITSGVNLYGLPLFLEKIFIRGYISIAFFILVMFAGALNPKWKITRKLQSIRAELAIIASIFIIPHALIYFVRFIVLKLPKMFSTGVIPKLYIAYIIAGIIAFVIMIPLFITSFKRIRHKMQSGKWRKLQKRAYIFYFLIYIHILIIMLNEKEIDLLKLSSYTIIFGTYTILRLIKYKNNRQSKLKVAS
ncbi:ferric reductase-like transmembrane domain-containing protein [Clostridium estertheticum]|uniref:ferric reductase-like transmembrane domain-containing protein n=1 Tax=Clostridium estertheticum TaxID=238834 RepID=UPI001CF21165|nr:ferric reductase-like transmembrane domain-containing protein [Clostridium estertheticum]MCB2305537.1 ferric reductase-like transmembrane domain-containing protein [Clostridium estertheticum]MCB2343976.1 ferric reductase-like transmembrane domain-containing protein [Clostridium estertheticum]MCB2348892.1 ferric reductase-like transmembrane domain-containing protein [Clostridium estertheticum]WAG46210.1 ferric reductase-like transmembrane domain-containing protein [Clostridium estertheticum]